MSRKKPPEPDVQFPGEGETEFDCFSRSKSEALARRLRNYWAARGHFIKTWVVAMPAPGGMVVYSIKSDMINGLPQ